MSSRPILIEYQAQSRLGRISWEHAISEGSQFNSMLLASEISSGVPDESKISDLHRRIETISDLEGIEMEAAEDTGPMFQIEGLTINEGYQPVALASPEISDFDKMIFSTREVGSLKVDEQFLLSADATDEAIDELMKHPDVLNVWEDSGLYPFEDAEPIITCATDLKPGSTTSQIKIADIKRELGFSELHQGERRGQDIAVAIVDTGMKLSKLARENKDVADRVVNGWPVTRQGGFAKWGTYRAGNSPHAEKSAETIGDLAPDVKLWDIRIEHVKKHTHLGLENDAAHISAAIAAFDWLLEQYKKARLNNIKPLPKVVNCSWGIYRRGQGEQYFANPNHPLVKKTLEMIRAGMIVIFAAGNCGEPCADGRCFPEPKGDNKGQSNQGPGNSILGVNGHEQTICVASSTLDSRYIPYSSQGPSTMGGNNPDVCGVSHYKTESGYFNGTSAAAPVVSAAVALMVQAYPDALQSEVQLALTSTANSSGFLAPSDHPQYIGHGLIQPVEAADRLSQILSNA